MANLFRGTTLEQDGRWGKADDKLIAKMTKDGLFSSILSNEVNLSKVNVDIMIRWVTEKLTELLGFEDEILINLIANMLQLPSIQGKQFQLAITGFLDKKTPSFVEELWTLLLDAQKQESGIPSVFIEKKKQEIQTREKSTLESTQNLSASGKLNADRDFSVEKSLIRNDKRNDFDVSDRNSRRRIEDRPRSRDRRARSPSGGRDVGRGRERRRRSPSPVRRRRSRSPARRRISRSPPPRRRRRRSPTPPRRREERGGYDGEKKEGDSRRPCEEKGPVIDRWIPDTADGDKDF